MNRYEKELLGVVTEMVYFSLIHEVDKEILIDKIDDVIYNLPLTCSTELLNNLYRIIDNLELGNELINEF